MVPSNGRIKKQGVVEVRNWDSTVQIHPLEEGS